MIDINNYGLNKMIIKILNKNCLDIKKLLKASFIQYLSLKVNW